MKQQQMADDALGDRDAAIGMLMSMGLSNERASQGLDATNDNVKNAIDYLVSNGEDESLSVAKRKELQVSPNSFRGSRRNCRRGKIPNNGVGSHLFVIDDDVEKQMGPANQIHNAGQDFLKYKLASPGLSEKVSGAANSHMNKLDSPGQSENGACAVNPLFACTSLDRSARPRNILPGAVAVDGVGGEEYRREYIAANERRIFDSMMPVTAQVVPNGEAVYEEFQERLRALEERENVTTVAHVISPHGNDGPANTLSNRRRTRILWAGIVGAMLVLVGLVLGFTLSRKPDAHQHLTDLLTSVSPDGGAALKTPSTPQNNALNWLAGNANLDAYSDDKKIQRYILATLYFSTRGDDWINNTGWLSDSDECDDWYNEADESFCSNGAVVELDFYRDIHANPNPSNNLDGSLPVELALLSNSLGESLLHSTLRHMLSTLSHCFCLTLLFIGSAQKR